MTGPLEEDAALAFQRFLAGFKRRRPEWFQGSDPKKAASGDVDDGLDGVEEQGGSDENSF